LEKISNSTGRDQLFGIFFIAISIAIVLASILSEIALLNKWPLYYNAVIWIGSFVISFTSLLYNKWNIWSSLRDRMKNSIKWPLHAKIINGVCWAGPFAVIAVLPSLFPYLILAGIGSGNVSTYLLLKRYKNINYDNNDNGSDAGRGQFIVGLISLVAIPFVFEVHTNMFTVRDDISVMLSRILISFAYAVGGIYSIMIKKR
ncbi:MAG TPA: hypothetical protein VKA91_06465, partial [Nitrososphaeraceae archaeon]|nr:hypothetical protein [Nitrososphaeraceae archaeon]